MADIPILLYRGMSESEYAAAKRDGQFQSSQQRYDNARLQIILSKRELEKSYDDDSETAEMERDAIQASIEMWEAELQARELSGEFEQTFWADTYANAANYGPVVVTIRTRGIERLFAPFPGRPGEWVSPDPIPASTMHGVQLQIKRTFPRRADVRVRGHWRRA